MCEESAMADGNSNNGFLYFLVGALCVAVAVGGFFIFGNSGTSSSTAQAPAAASAPATPTVTKNITIEKTEPTRVIERAPAGDHR
jgi:hypothetical protein